ncbi:MAG: magnesium transporter, partial [Defluviitaleaceae bacterium]|nr:magnesium transporter [Defluviitaleaceae bacterium]
MSKRTYSTNLPHEKAGAIMQREFIALNKKLKVKEALELVMRRAGETHGIYAIYVTNVGGKQLEGVISLRELMASDPNFLLQDIRKSNVISVTQEADREEVANIILDNNFFSVPVVNQFNEIIGIVTVNEAIDIVQDEATEDIYKAAGIATTLDPAREKEGKRSNTLINGRLLDIWKIRIPILLMVLVGGFLAGMIVEGFEETLEAATMIAFFIPLIMDMGGSVGGQSTTIFARGFVLGHIKAGYFWKQFFKEAMVGFTIGAVVGFFAYFGVGIWLGDWGLALAVSLALVANCLIAASAGFLVPYFLIKIGADQASGSGPIITSIKD